MFYPLKIDDRFEISKCGIIRMIKNKRVKKQYVGDTGYYMVTISKNNKCNPHRVHRLLAINFIDNPENLKEVNHIDGNKLNYELKNLEWVTHYQNMRHAVDMGLLDNVGSKNGMAKLDAEQVVEIKKLLNQGMSQYKICKIYNVSRSAILAIKIGKNWKHITI